MYRDLGINNTAFVRIEFGKYFDQLIDIGESGVSQLNRTLFQYNIDNNIFYGNCRNLSYILMRNCTILDDNKTVEMYDIQNYTIFREDRDNPKDPLRPIAGYFWDIIALTIKNVPTLPYET